jgi:hypothetical protein
VIMGLKLLLKLLLKNNEKPRLLLLVGNQPF